MAHELKYWVGGTLLACAVLLVALVPPGGQIVTVRWVGYYRATPSAPEARAAELLRRHLARENAVLFLLETRDSLLPLMSRPPRPSGITLFADRRLPAGIRGALDLALGRTATVVPALVQPEVRVAVAVLLDTARATVPRVKPYWVWARYVLPAATDGRTCLAVLTLGRGGAAAFTERPSLADALARTRAPLAQLLGPCAYYGAFGSPGDSVTAWLERAEFRPAELPAWAFHRNLPTLAERGVRQPRRNVFQSPAGLFDDLYEGAYALAGCAGRDREACHAAIFGPPRPPRALFRIRDMPQPPDDPGIVGGEVSRRRRDHPLGRGTGTFLSDLVVDQGPERFRRFWQSPLPVDSAFAQAMGMPIEEWTARWARSQMGAPVRGAAVGVGAALLGMLTAGVFVGGAALLVRRRQVG